VLNTLLTPIYTSYFAAADFGIVTGLYAYVSFLNVVFTYGLETTFFRFSSQPGVDRRQIYNRIVSLLLLSSIGMAVLLILLARPLLASLGIPAGHEQFAEWMVLTLACSPLCDGSASQYWPDDGAQPLFYCALPCGIA
jgi:O-antigen/teichoic acid export membrane protein